MLDVRDAMGEILDRTTLAELRDGSASASIVLLYDI